MHPTPATSRHDRTEDVSPVKARLSRILDGSDFPALSRQIIDTISVLDDDASSLQRLANVVLREYSLTLSVVRTANSTHYRRSGRPIQSATHAMMMLGANTVRHLASSLLLFENYHKRSAGLKELMLLSLLTANHAREVATRLGTGDPEEAHLCGMFRNLGEVLVACHFPEDYARIHAITSDTKQTDAQAAFAVLGFRYEDLGEELSRHWGMPESVLQGIRARSAAASSNAAAITLFSHELTNAIYRRDPELGDAQAALDEVMVRHAPRLKLSRDQVRGVVEAALSETRELFVIASVSMDALRLRQLSHAASSALGVPSLQPVDWDAVPVPPAETPGSPELRDRLRQDLESRIDPASESDLGQVLLLALEGALRGAPFDRVIACVLNADSTRLRARSGLGAGVEELMTQFDFPMTPRGGPVVTALLQRMPLYFSDRTMNKADAQWAAGIDAGQFGVYPIMVGGRIVGCLYGDRAAADPLPDRAAQQYLRSLSDLVVKAIDARRRAAAAADRAGWKTSVAADAQGLQGSATIPIHSQTPVTWSAALQSSLSTGATMSAESKGALVLRLLQGDDARAVGQATGVSVAELEHWRKEFLEGALARLSGG